MFELGKVYTHSRMLDTAIYVLGRFNPSDDYYLTVRWFTRSGLDLNQTEMVTIKKEEVHNWYEI